MEELPELDDDDDAADDDDEESELSVPSSDSELVSESELELSPLSSLLLLLLLLLLPLLLLLFSSADNPVLRFLLLRAVPSFVLSLFPLPPSAPPRSTPGSGPRCCSGAAWSVTRKVSDMDQRIRSARFRFRILSRHSESNSLARSPCSSTCPFNCA